MKQSVLRQGTAMPTDSVGADGDFYYKSDTGDLYQKVSGVYMVVASLGSSVGSDLYLFNNY